jgi:diacylglycerol kinase family enzyme
VPPALNGVSQAHPIPVIVNVSAGGGRESAVAGQLRELFGRHGVSVEVHCASSGEELAGMARRAMQSKPPILVAGGGDGTLSAVADAVRGTDTAFGVLPLGTFNHFAKDLGIPIELEKAVEVIACGERKAVDVGEVNGACFLNNASLGIYPVIVRRREFQQRTLGRRKFSAMAWAIWSVLRRSPFMRLRVELDGGESRAWRAPFIFIGNNIYNMQGFDIGTRERLDCGQLSIYSTPRGSRWGLFKLALHALFGRLQQSKDFVGTAARELRVESRRPRLRVAADGEVRLLQTPLEFRIVPRSLLVMTPKPEASP